MESWIYIIRADGAVLYVGSTTNLRSRKTAHRSLSQRSDKPLYQSIRRIGGWESVEFRVLELNFGLTNTQKRIQEQAAIERLRPIYNLNRAYTALSGTPYHREYRAERLERFRAYNREYLRLNRDRICAQRRLARARRISAQAELTEAAVILETLEDRSE